MGVSIMALLQCGIITTCSHMNITHAVHSDGGWCQHPWKTAKVKGAKSHWVSVQQRVHVGVKGQTAHSCIRISREIHVFPQLILIMSICMLPLRGQSLFELKEQFTQNLILISYSPLSNSCPLKKSNFVFHILKKSI